MMNIQMKASLVIAAIVLIFFCISYADLCGRYR